MTASLGVNQHLLGRELGCDSRVGDLAVIQCRKDRPLNLLLLQKRAPEILAGLPLVATSIALIISAAFVSFLKTSYMTW